MERYLLYISLLLILSLSVPTVFPVTHSHFFFTTVTNDFTSSYPDYYMTRSIDDITLLRYDSDNQVILRRVSWFRSTYPTLLAASFKQLTIQTNLQYKLQYIMGYLNDTEGDGTQMTDAGIRRRTLQGTLQEGHHGSAGQGFHIFQLLQGCVRYDNGTYDTIFSSHYDGEPFLAFSVEEANWIPEDPKAQYLAEILNINKNETEDLRNSLLHECIPHISQLLSQGNCTFNRREQPVVVVAQTPITNTIYRLHCRAYGHYPKDISMTWYKNGQPMPESLMERVTLPFPDITYLTWMSMNITLMDHDVYICSVTHSSVMSPLMARLSRDSPHLSEGNNGPNVGGSGISIGGIIGICLIATVLVVSIVFGSVWWAKNRRL